MTLEAWSHCEACDRWFFCESWSWAAPTAAPPACPGCGGRADTLEAVPTGLRLVDLEVLPLS